MEYMEGGDLDDRLHNSATTNVSDSCVVGVRRGTCSTYTNVQSLDNTERKKSGIRTALTWAERMNVALDVSQALVYMHHECSTPVIHRDVKPKNILLTVDMVAKLADFGIAKLLHHHNDSSTVTAARGSIGYFAPGIFAETCTSCCRVKARSAICD
jgi:serine/threonine protein kinase